MKHPLTLAAVLVAFSGTASFANVSMPTIFSEHMVLQKAEKVPVWGRADAGEEVSVTLNGQTSTTKAGPDGKWQVSLDLKDSPPGPFELIIKGKNEIKIADVVVGQVWIASGQSNMAWTLDNTLDAKAEIAQSANPMLRQFSVKRSASPTPADKVEGAWTVASPETSAKFSAVGYYFGKTLQRDLQAPVGIISSNWGGTPSEAWTSKEAVAKLEGADEARARHLKALEEFPAVQEGYKQKVLAWLKANDREDRTPENITRFTGPEAAAVKWSQVKLPGAVQGASLPSGGALWLRKEIAIRENEAGKPFRLDYGITGGYDEIYWNGELIKAAKPSDASVDTRRRLDIPPDKVKAGQNIVAIRIFAPQEAVISGQGLASKKFSGPWQVAAEYSFPAFDPASGEAFPKPPATPLSIQNTATTLYNGMIAPLIPYAIKGAIWYQGESNSGRAYEYREAFPLMITDWRSRWQQGDFPFYFCQLANFMAKQPEPTESGWAELREAQSMTLKTPQTGQAVLIDIGESEDIHPRNKKDVGERLALIALANDYGKSVEYSGPVYQSMKVEDGKIRLSFAYANHGLMAKPLNKTYDVKTLISETAPLVRNSPKSELEGFAICGTDKKWVWADARIDGEEVVVWSDKVPEPVAVRYAWADNPTCNLYNSAGLPASPFRTDDYPGVTVGKKYSN